MAAFVTPGDVENGRTDQSRRLELDGNWKNLEEAKDFAWFRAELAEMPSEIHSLKEEKQILEGMRRTPSTIENRMHEDPAKLSEVSQTRLLDSLGASGCHDCDWWYHIS